MNELMERLARANPTPAGEGLTPEEQREADALLEHIVTEPAADERPKHAPSLRRLVPAAGLLATLVIAAVVVVDLVDSEDGRGGIIERAVAAVTKDDVIYAITQRASFRSVALEPGTETTPDERLFERSWAWAEGDRSHALRYSLRADGRPGRLLGEVVATTDRITWFDARGRVELDYDRDRDDPPPEKQRDAGGRSAYPGFDPSWDPGAQLRAHVDNGRLRLTGRTTVRGRTAYRLVAKADPGAPAAEDFGTVTYFVDARTYLPLEIRQTVVFDHSDVPDGGRERASFRIEYLRYDALPVNERTKTLLEPGAGRLP
jgi:hypothetical protein